MPNAAVFTAAFGFIRIARHYFNPLEISPINFIVCIPAIAQEAAPGSNTQTWRLNGLWIQLIAIIVLINDNFVVSMPFAIRIAHDAQAHVIVGIAGVGIHQVPLSVVIIQGVPDAAVRVNGAVILQF